MTKGVIAAFCSAVGLGVLAGTGGAWAQDDLLPSDDPALHSPTQKRAPTAFADDPPRPVLDWGQGRGKSYVVPAFDILLFDSLLNFYNQHSGADDADDYRVSRHSLEDNLTGNWVYDSDRFDINQFGHPYQGSMYHGFARSAGLGYWEAAAYTFGGSLAWEIFGERTPPSVNDQFTTGLAGSFLGEPLVRMASLLLESGPSGSRPSAWRELGAAFISPASGFNRLAYGDRFDGVFRSNNPAVYTRLDVGGNVASNVDSNINRRVDSAGVATPQSYDEGEAIADFTLAYGLPGKRGYSHDRPFDYFHFQFTAATSNALENVITRGLLYGTDYSIGDHYRGIWGLYGTYDYLAPQIFRVSTTAVAVGTTYQWWASRRVALQGTTLLGAGYGSGGNIRGEGNRDYHSGVTPQAMSTLRFIFGDRVSLDLTVRDYYISDVLSEEDGGEENILRADASLTLRVFNLHGITFKYVMSRRNAHYDQFPDADQRVAALSIGYALLGQTRSGAVDWRPRSQGGP